MAGVSTDTKFSNRILASLSKADGDRIIPFLSRTIFEQGKTLLAPGEKSKFAYFMEDGLTSMVTSLSDGSTVEIGLLGREGMVGMHGLMGAGTQPFHSFIQLAGSGFRIKAEVVAQEFERSERFRRKLFLFSQAQLVQTSQIAACNRRHDVHERLARWLLTCRDRCDSDLIELTHEFLAQMLGAPRTTVTLAAGVLQNAGLIEYSRGRVTILDRERLEEAACECYTLIRDEFVRLKVL
jgi:CRP-like cAMP-binding protein